MARFEEFEGRRRPTTLAKIEDASTLSPRKNNGLVVCARADGGRPRLLGFWGSRVLGSEAMPTYVVLSKFTEQGVSKIKDTVKRSEDFRKAAKKAGVSVKEVLWTQGQYDVVTVLEAQDENAAMALGISVAKLGNIRSETLRAFTAGELEKILEKVA
jgi:uncharacterized protein with GYD domain